MKSNPRQLPQMSGMRPGFNMLEILISMAIFAIGFVAVSAIFPAAIYLQKQTADAVQGESLERSITAQLKARAYSIVADLGGGAGPTEVVALPIPTPTRGFELWPLMDRSFPSTQPTLSQRRYVWVPLMQRLNNPANTNSDWRIWVFLMYRDGTASYADPTTYNGDGAYAYNTSNNPPNMPQLVSTEVTISGGHTFNLTPPFTNAGIAYLRSGDQILANDGVIYTALSVTTNTVRVQGSITGTPSKIWFAPPASGSATSPILKIIPLSGTDCVKP